MGIGKPKPEQAKARPIQSALYALEPTADPLNLEMGSYCPSPATLSLGNGEETGARRHHSCICAECGRPLRRDPR